MGTDDSLSSRAQANSRPGQAECQRLSTAPFPDRRALSSREHEPLVSRTKHIRYLLPGISRCGRLGLKVTFTPAALNENGTRARLRNKTKAEPLVLELICLVFAFLSPNSLISFPPGCLPSKTAR